jgi:hypothetical protein
MAGHFLTKSSANCAPLASTQGNFPPCKPPSKYGVRCASEDTVEVALVELITIANEAHHLTIDHMAAGSIDRIEEDAESRRLAAPCGARWVASPGASLKRRVGKSVHAAKALH